MLSPKQEPQAQRQKTKGEKMYHPFQAYIFFANAVETMGIRGTEALNFKDKWSEVFGVFETKDQSCCSGRQRNCFKQSLLHSINFN